MRQYAIPCIISLLVGALYNIVDQIFIANASYLGSYGNAANTVVFPLTVVALAIAVMVGDGCCAFVSMALGRNEVDKAKRSVGNAMVLSVVSSLVLTAVYLMFANSIIAMFGGTVNEETFHHSQEYFFYITLGIPFYMFGQAMNPIIRADGNPKFAMISTLVGAVINIILDPIFIFGLHMGVRGAALATVLSQAVSCVWVLRFLTGPRTALRLKRQYFRPQARLILPCVALGLAAFIMQSSESVISICFNSSLLKYGGDPAVGAMTILSSVMQFAMLPLQGIAQGAQPITSYNYGARNSQRVRASFRLLLTVSLIYSVLLWAAIMLFPQLFARMFTPNPELIAFTARALRLYCGALFLFGLQIACQMTFVSIGNAPCSIFVAVLRKFILLLPLIYLLPHLLPDQTSAVYLAEPTADVIAMSCTAVLFSRQFKKALKKLDEPLP